MISEEAPWSSIDNRLRNFTVEREVPHIGEERISRMTRLQKAGEAERQAELQDDHCDQGGMDPKSCRRGSDVTILVC